MRSGSNVTKTLLEFSSVWHGVCIYWNENIHSVKPCVTHVPHPSHCHPPPLPPEGVPPQIRGHSCSWEFLPQKWKNAGVPFLKTEKTQEGVPVSEGGLPEKFEERKNSGGGTRFGRGLWGNFWERENLGRGYPFWKGVYGENFGKEKTQEGVPVSEGGLPENFEEREKRRLEPIKNGKNSGRGVPFWKGVYRKNLE